MWQEEIQRRDVQLAEDRLLREQQVGGPCTGLWNVEEKSTGGRSEIGSDRRKKNNIILSYSASFFEFLMVFSSGTSKHQNQSKNIWHLQDPLAVSLILASQGCSPHHYQQWIYRISFCIPWPSVSLHRSALVQYCKGPRIWGGIACRSTRSCPSSWGGPFCKISKI